MKKDKYQVLEDIIKKKEKEIFKTLTNERILSKDTIQNLLTLGEVQTHLNYEVTLDYIMVFPKLEEIAPYILENPDILLGSRIVIENIHYAILKQELFYLFMEKYNVTDPYEKLYYFINCLPKEDYSSTKVINNYLNNYPATELLANQSHKDNHTMPKYEENSLRILFSIDFANDLNESETVQLLRLVQEYHYDYMDKNVKPHIEDEEFDINKCIKKVTQIIIDNQESKKKNL